MKKGIQGQLIADENEQTIKNIKENSEVFKGATDVIFKECIVEYDIYRGTYNDKNVIGIDFNILGKTVKDADKYYSLFKKELKNYFGIDVKEIIKAKYDKI